jgi:hypothetical protein
MYLKNSKKDSKEFLFMCVLYTAYEYCPYLSHMQQLIPVMPATWEAKIRRIFEGSPEFKS